MTDQKLVPHSTPWFEALNRFNPEQAAHTAAVVRMAGRLDVCSVCGDEPVADYEMDASCAVEGAVRTLRLCGDCLRIRKAQGERFKAMI